MLDAYRDLIDELLGTPTDIRTLLDAAGDAKSSGETRRLIAGLRDRDRAVLERVQAINRQQTPYLRALDIPPAASDEELSVLLEEMETARGDLVSLLMNLTLKDWARDAIHETGGEITLADEVEEHVEFDEAQRLRLRELLTA